MRLTELQKERMLASAGLASDEHPLGQTRQPKPISGSDVGAVVTTV
jgi:hypothetical protein